MNNVQVLFIVYFEFIEVYTRTLLPLKFLERPWKGLNWLKSHICNFSLWSRNWVYECYWGAFLDILNLRKYTVTHQCLDSFLWKYFGGSEDVAIDKFRICKCQLAWFRYRIHVWCWGDVFNFSENIWGKLKMTKVPFTNIELAAIPPQSIFFRFFHSLGLGDSLLT